VLARGEKGGSAALAAKKARKRGVAAAAADPAAARYAFLYDETLPAERDDVVAQLKKAKAPAARAALQARLTRLSQALAAERTRRAAVERERARRAVERTAVRGGKAPFYPKASDLRRQALAARFDALKADGKLDAHLAKRRKRNAAKDHRYLPSVRREG
jgi:ribosomal RNA-processing protein 36